MISVQELRIGNFLCFELPNGSKVHYKSARISYDFDGFRTVASVNGIGVEKVYGIVLTDDWLKKFGFARIDRHFQHNWVISVNHSGDYYSVQFHEGKFWLSNSEYGAWCYVIRDISYVHQLQNLYFDLTGEELVARD